MLLYVHLAEYQVFYVWH